MRRADAGVANIAAMLAPNGILLHNEPRPVLRDLAATVRLPLQHSRQAVIARGGAPAARRHILLHARARR